MAKAMTEILESGIDGMCMRAYLRGQMQNPDLKVPRHPVAN